MRFRIPKYFPGWFVSGGGGSGGAATVQTDGVTIQGDGSAGNKIAIKAVQTDATLTGAGTVASPLVVDHPTGWPVTIWLPQGATGGTNHSFPTNTLDIYGIQVKEQVRFSQIYISIAQLDNAHLYDVGIYNFAGTLLANIGPIGLPATGNLFFTTNQSAQTINPGIYWFVFTGNNGTAQYQTDLGGRQTVAYASAQATQSSAGGTCPATITPLAKSYTNTQGFVGLVL